MQLLEAEFTNWCQIAHLLVQFSNNGRAHLIRGRNNGGKSNMLRGICWNLDFTRGTSAFGSAKSINRYTKAETATVRTKWAEGDKVHEIIRITGKKKTDNMIIMDGVEVTLTEAGRIFQEEWGFPHPEQLISLLILPQGRTDLLVRESGSVREERLGRIKGLHRIKAKIAELEKKRKALKAEREALAAEGIVAIEKEAYKTRVENDVARAASEIDQLAKLLLTEHDLHIHRAAIKVETLHKQKAELDALTANITKLEKMLLTPAQIAIAGAALAIHENQPNVSALETSRSEIKALEPQILSPAQLLRHQQALVAEDKAKIEAEISSLLDSLPDWVPGWMDRLRRELKMESGPTLPAATIIANIDEAIRREKTNQQIALLKGRITVLQAKVGAQPASWPLLRIAAAARAKVTTTRTDYQLTDTSLPSEGELAAWADAISIATLHAAATAAEKSLGAGTTGPYPYEDQIDQLYQAMQGQPLPTVCPVSNGPLTTVGITNARKAAAQRKADGQKNAVLQEFLSQAKRIPQLKGESSATALIKRVKDAKAVITPEILRWVQRAGSIAEIRHAENAAAVAEANATNAYAEWATLTEEKRSTLLSNTQKLEASINDLLKLGEEQVVIPERFTNPEQRGLLTKLETLVRKADAFQFEGGEETEAVSHLKMLGAPTIRAALKAHELAVPALAGKRGTERTLVAAIQASTAKIAQILAGTNQTEADAQKYLATNGEKTIRTILRGDEMLKSQLGAKNGEREQVRKQLSVVTTEVDALLQEHGTIKDAEKLLDAIGTASITKILEKHENDALALANKRGIEQQLKVQLAKIDQDIKDIHERKLKHDAKQEEENAFSEAVDFLQPGNGPREIIRLDLVEALDETNERLAEMGIDLVLECDAELQIYAGSADSMLDPDTRTEGELLGMGYGALAGTFLHAALLRQFNETAPTGKIENLILDEPTAFMRPHMKPGFYQSLTTGAHAVRGVIMVEHERAAESFVEGITDFGGAGDASADGNKHHGSGISGFFKQSADPEQN